MLGIPQSISQFLKLEELVSHSSARGVMVKKNQKKPMTIVTLLMRLKTDGIRSMMSNLISHKMTLLQLSRSSTMEEGMKRKAKNQMKQRLCSIRTSEVTQVHLRKRLQIFNRLKNLHRSPFLVTSAEIPSLLSRSEFI